MRPPSGQDDGLRLFAADKQMGRTELLPFTPNVCVLRCRRVQLRGELCSALGAATGEDLAAVGGSHSLSESVYFGSVELLGLIGARSSLFVLPPEKILPAAPLLEVLHLLDGGQRKLPADRS